ncbi:hypothetical protein RIF29_30493 [Crotalaria pallida]|uniref:Cation/H+ exchanger domain-containing protein n=1 Tax=Crotalaria pallida TaxID=3830 RepID=A0AAN9HYA3_CROPI
MPDILSQNQLGCYQMNLTNPNDIWRSQSVLQSTISLFGAQVAFILFSSRLLYYILRPFNQPLIVFQIIVGFMMNKETGGKVLPYLDLFPLESLVSGETISYIGLILYVFLIGLDMNIDTILKARKKATSIAVAGVIIPMVIGACLYEILLLISSHPEWGYHHLMPEKKPPTAYLFWSLILSVTGFPILAHILADLKLLYTGLGKVALTVAMIIDFYNWVMFSLLIPFCIHGYDVAIYSVLSNIIFVHICYFGLRPHLAKLIMRKTVKDDWDNIHLFYVVIGAFACALITDILGIHPIVGALVYGIMIPRGKFATLLVNKLEDFAGDYLVPWFFFSCGVRLKFSDVFQDQGWVALVGIVILSCIPKILSTVVTTFFFGMSASDGVTLGLLMNTKGILSLIMLNIGMDKKILSPGSFTILSVANLAMTVMVPLIINAIYKPRKRFAQNKLRTIQNLKVDADLRILACVHNTRHAMGMVNLLEAFNAVKVSQLHAFSLQLIELTGNTTSLLAAHIELPNPNPNHELPGSQALTQTESHLEMENIANVFRSYVEENNDNNKTTVETLVAVSSYSTIHEDIHNLAQEKQATFILLPFHKHSTIEGVMELTNTAYKDINQNVVGDAPCSLAIFVDRGLGSLLKIKLRVVVLFIGGPDDREALAVAWRMSKHKGIQLSMVRIFLSGEANELDPSASFSESRGLLTGNVDNEKQKELDDEYVSSFRLKAVNNEDSISYSEKEVHSGDDITLVLNELDTIGYDLYIVGQGSGQNYIVLSDLLKWTECPELGVIGDIVASNSFASSSSLLVVQQYGFGGTVFGTTTQQHPSEVASKAVFVKVE